MHLNWFWQIVGWLSVPLLVMLTVVVSWRKVWREFAVFFWYVLLATMTVIVRFIAYRFGYATYFFAYWISDVFMLAFAIAVIYDLFARRLFAGFLKVGFYRRLFPIAVIVTVLVAIFMATQAPSKTAMFMIASRTLNFIQVAFLGFFGGLMLFMGRNWTRYELGISLGFALNACVVMMLSVLRLKLHYQSSIADQLPALAYDISCLIWLLYCWPGPENATSRLAPITLTPEMVEHARKLEQQLRNWLSGKRCF